MATSEQVFAATITAGTPKASPMTVNLSVLPGTIDLIRWRVPPGPRGNLGWQLGMSGVSIIPENSGIFIVADDESDTVQISGLPDSGAWQVIGYNTGTNDHTVYLYFHVTPVGADTGIPTVTGAGFPQSDAEVQTMWLT